MMTVKYLHPGTKEVLTPAQIAERAKAKEMILVEVNGSQRLVLAQVIKEAET